MTLATLIDALANLGLSDVLENTESPSIAILDHTAVLEFSSSSVGHSFIQLYNLPTMEWTWVKYSEPVAATMISAHNLRRISDYVTRFGDDILILVYNKGPVVFTARRYGLMSRVFALPRDFADDIIDDEYNLLRNFASLKIGEAYVHGRSAQRD